MKLDSRDASSKRCIEVERRGWSMKKKGRSVSTPSTRYVCDPSGWETIPLSPPNLYRDRIIDPCRRDRLLRPHVSILRF